MSFVFLLLWDVAMSYLYGSWINLIVIFLHGQVRLHFCRVLDAITLWQTITKHAMLVFVEELILLLWNLVVEDVFYERIRNVIVQIELILYYIFQFHPHH